MKKGTIAIILINALFVIFSLISFFLTNSAADKIYSQVAATCGMNIITQSHNEFKMTEEKLTAAQIRLEKTIEEAKEKELKVNQQIPLLSEEAISKKYQTYSDELSGNLSKLTEAKTIGDARKIFNTISYAKAFEVTNNIPLSTACAVWFCPILLLIALETIALKTSKTKI